MTISGKTVFLIGAAILAGLVIVQLKDVHIAIGERAMGGYDSSSNPEAASRADPFIPRGELRCDSFP